MMDDHQFDALARALSGSRRALLGLGVALGLTTIPVDARKRRKRRKKKRKRNKKKKKTCQGCTNGQVCLGNGSCAQTCSAAADCPAECQCGAPSVEGLRHCTPDSLYLCASLVECSSSAACPAGSHCEQTMCSGNPNRCLPLCGSV